MKIKKMGFFIFWKGGGWRGVNRGQLKDGMEGERDDGWEGMWSV